MDKNLENAYAEANSFAKSHYENFPVVSFFISKRLRKHVAVIYQFARKADDFADEGDKSKEERLHLLNEYEDKLKNCLNGNPENNFWYALNNTISFNNLSEEHFFNMIKAFKQDVTKKQYENFKEVEEYCKCSANPVGRLILELHDIRNNDAFYYSDYICTALQLTNFYQDVGIDYSTDRRVYLPKDELKKFEVDENSFKLKHINANFINLLRFQIDRTREFFRKGRILLDYLPGRLKYQIKWTILGGEKILDKIEKIDYNVLNLKPKLSKSDYLRLMIKSFFI